MMEKEPEQDDWRNLLAGGFAYMSAPFAVHPLDALRARRMVFATMREGVSVEDIMRAAEDYLNSQSWNPPAISKEVKRVERFVRSVKPAQKKKSAWLITWEHAGSENSDLIERIIAIRDSRTSSDKIKDFVEQHYIAVNYSPAEKMHYSSHRRDNPYPADYFRHSKGWVWTARIHCGHNPYIYARFVRNLRLYDDDTSGFVLTWDDIPVPETPSGWN